MNENTHGKPFWDQTTIDRLWVTTQREAMIESGPPPAATHTEPSSAQEQKAKKERAKKQRAVDAKQEL